MSLHLHVEGVKNVYDKTRSQMKHMRESLYPYVPDRVQYIAYIGFYAKKGFTHIFDSCVEVNNLCMFRH